MIPSFHLFFFHDLLSEYVTFSSFSSILTPCRSHVHLRSFCRGNSLRFSPAQAPHRCPHISQSPLGRHSSKHNHLLSFNSHRPPQNWPFKDGSHCDRERCFARGRNGVACVLATSECYQAFCSTSLGFGIQLLSSLNDRGTWSILTGSQSILLAPHLADASQV
jgi:hypothetical protein